MKWDSLIELLGSWGDVEPINTLVARFYANKSWRLELPALAQIFRSSLRGEFQDYKFRRSNSGADESLRHAQVGWLTAGELDRWSRQRAIIALAKNGQELTTQQIEHQLKSDALLVLRNNLLPHLEEAAKEKSKIDLHSKVLNRDQIAKFIEIIRAAGRNPSVCSEQLNNFLKNELKGQAFNEADGDYHRIAFSTIVSFVEKNPAAAIELFRNSASLLKSMLKSDKDDSLYAFGFLKSQILGDIAAMNSYLRTSGDGSKSDKMILSVVNSDPKLLLTVGDLVPGASSCQNYRTGGVIYTLPGYVIDANVQAMASFSLGNRDFLSPGEYDQVRAAVDSGNNLEIEFDGNLRVANFVVEEKRIFTRPLAGAIMRQMLKLGQGIISKKPGLALEPEYTTPGVNMNERNLAHAQHHQLLGQLSEELGSAGPELLSVPPSRNPGGVYSDLSRGIHAGGAYQINATPIEGFPSK